MTDISWEEVQMVEIRVGTIVEVQDFSDAIKPAYKLKVDLGEEIGIKQSSAQITDLYSKEDLIGKQIMVIANLSPKKIGPFTSEVLVTGFYRGNNDVVLAVPEKKIENGSLLS